MPYPLTVRTVFVQIVCIQELSPGNCQEYPGNEDRESGHPNKLYRDSQDLRRGAVGFFLKQESPIVDSMEAEE